jgi:hypothetical protein
MEKELKTILEFMKQHSMKITGYLLLTPSVISVFIFLIQLISKNDLLKHFRQTIWTGEYDFGYAYESGGGGAGYTSALPIYFGLMAIAGAYLIKDKN